MYGIFKFFAILLVALVALGGVFAQGGSGGDGGHGKAYSTQNNNLRAYHPVPVEIKGHH